MEKKNKQTLRSVPVYLPEAKHAALDRISEIKRMPKTRLIEQEIDKLIKRENNS